MKPTTPSPTSTPTTTNDPTLEPITIEQAEWELAGVGNVLPMTDDEVERIMDHVMKRVRAGDN